MKRPNCKLCETNDVRDNTYVFIEEDGLGLVHKICYRESRQESQEEIREARKQARIEAAEIRAERLKEELAQAEAEGSVRVELETGKVGSDQNEL